MGDPYKAVQAALQSGERSRAELKTVTGLSYPEIEAALYRFCEVTGNAAKRMDGGGIERYSWTGVADPAISLGANRHKAEKISARNPVESAQRAVTEPAGRPEKLDIGSARPANWSLTTEVRKLITAMDDREEFEMRTVLERLRLAHPSVVNGYDQSSLRTQISVVLNNLKVNKLIHATGSRSPRNAIIYRRGAASPEAALSEPIKDDVTLRAAPSTLIDQRASMALRAASLEFAYFQFWGEHSPKFDDVLSMIVTAGESLDCHR